MTPPSAVILSQGDEVLTGRTVNTNAAWLGDRLNTLGMSVLWSSTTPDNVGAIARSVRDALDAADVIVSTGGLGPTTDDLTSEAVARALGVALALDPTALDQIRARYRNRGRSMPEANTKQALFPAGATPLENLWGTAPGFSIEVKKSLAFFLPGVPSEMRALFDHHLLPALERRFELQKTRRTTLHCMGAGESTLQERLDDVEIPEGVVVHYRAGIGINQIVLEFAPDIPEEEADALVARCRAALGRSCFGVDCGSLAHTVGAALTERGETVSSAESCTGGQVSSLITAVPGASKYFLEGACVYSNDAKMRACGVPTAVIETHGAVSEAVARCLAQGIQSRAESTYGLSTTGIAGPSGERPDKPVGTMHIALATPESVVHRRLQLHGSRSRITAIAALSSLDLLRRHLQGHLPTQQS